MRTYGLIGFPLSHSFSAKYFANKFENENIRDAEYVNFPLEKIELFPGLISDSKTLNGLNVTIPWKEEVIPFLNALSREAEEIGAVNTIKVSRYNGKIAAKGFNTDWIGFVKPIMQQLSNIRSAIILGTGGASKAVRYALEKNKISFAMVSRSNKPGCITYTDLDKGILDSVDLIVNTTPLGTFPEVNLCPDLPFMHLESKHLVYDLVYNPEKSELLKRSEKHGARIINGYRMLVEQAEESWKIWNSPKL